MQQVPADIWAAFERRLDQAQAPADQRPDYHKWVRFSSRSTSGTCRGITGEPPERHRRDGRMQPTQRRVERPE